ncbi:MAG: NUDIX hydrolase [Deltaproteobacteria bacterium]|nr:NUDIX hydrolase [Deltaproteobacteria bacterium]MBW2311609.1 NUDIX hydrolase [Deltaproteobacteria bacterium]
MKRQGSSIIFINDNNEILLFLRDDKPSIPFPNMWDLPGGHVEENETPEESIVREMKEELELDIKECQLFSVSEFPDRIEYTFWEKANLDIDRIRLHEGQYLRWFNENEIENTELAMGFNQILRDFFTKDPFSDSPSSW